MRRVGIVLTIRLVRGAEVTQIDRDSLAGARAGPGWLWIDLADPDDAESSVLTAPGVDLDPLTREDMREDRHLPKVDVHGDELALTVHGVALETVGVELTTVELDIALKEGLLVTYREERLASVAAVARRLDRRGAGHLDRPAALLHLILDSMTDVLVPFVDHLDRRLDVIEEDILTEPTEATRHDIYHLERDVIQLRRAVVPQAEVIRRLTREPVGLLAEADRELLRDVYDHLYRAAELCDSYHQLLASAMASYRSALDDSLNRMLTILTLFSTVLLPITMVAGIYGMNFEHMPELSVRWAYPALWGVFGLIVVGMLTWARRRGWIGRDAERAATRRRAGLARVLEIPLLGRVLEVPASGTRRGLAVVSRAGRRLARRPRPEPGRPGPDDW